ncbi:Electron transfer flavoprotein subunit beta family protein [Desulfonema magnum]|uniref:Electron transfer flavoprotein subunit beta n=1 Tax=Desulfonema magnum TaxID=45655 RepID=A0A975BKC3_9BACT|nr:Electron transfer flavoprotein subunit beta family protein [Desulfonema magnum]
MEIIVLVKQVLATETAANRIEANFGNCSEDTGTWIINPHDEIAVEEALRIREAHGGNVTVVSFGKEFAVDTVRQALAMGADKGVLILDDLSGDYRDSVFVAQVFSLFLKKMPFSIILAGSRSVDGNSFLAGPALAEMLSVPCLSMVVKQEIRGDIIRCHKRTENGRMIVEAPLPVVITAASGLNSPRYTTVPGIKRAENKTITILSLSDIGMDKDMSACSLSKIVAFNPRDNKRSLKMADGSSPEEKARRLAELLQQEAGVI